MDGFLPVFIMVLLGMVFAALGAFLPGILAVRKPTLAKEAPYECGIVPSREPAERFPVRFYLVAMIFIIFDIEIIFLYPWAVIYRQLGPFGLWEMLIFAVAVFVSFIYLIGNGALTWGPAKSAPYECGIVPRRDPPDRFPVRFYLVAMIFIIFDIEIIFLYPYAIVHRELGAFGLWEMVLFAVAVFASFVYLIANGALDWGPLRRHRDIGDSGMVSATRTATTTVRRVGLDGREPVEAA